MNMLMFTFFKKRELSKTKRICDEATGIQVAFLSK